MPDDTVLTVLEGVGSPGLCEPCLAKMVSPSHRRYLDQAVERLWTSREIQIGLAKCVQCSDTRLVWRTADRLR
jgi:hypothetical protein